MLCGGRPRGPYRLGPTAWPYSKNHPSALQSGSGLQIYTLFQNYPGPRGSFQVAVGLVQASPQCTDS